MDFYRIAEQPANKNGVIEVFPDFRVTRSKDLMVRGRGFYAIWDEEVGLWSTDEYAVQRLIDDSLYKYQKDNEGVIVLKLMGNFSSNSWLQFRNYVGHLSDSNYQLDEHLTFANSVVKKGDFVSRRLPYSLEGGDISAYKEMFELLYEPDELAKLEWAIGAIIAGDVADRIGRRNTIVIGCGIYIIGVVLQIASHGLGLLVAGRLVAGVGVGFESAIVILYMSEIVSAAQTSTMIAC